MATTSESNNGLYFITGALLVLVLGMAVFYFAGTESGNEVVRDTTTVIERNTDTNDEASGASFEFSIDDDGVEASSQTEN